MRFLIPLSAAVDVVAMLLARLVFTLAEEALPEVISERKMELGAVMVGGLGDGMLVCSFLDVHLDLCLEFGSSVGSAVQCFEMELGALNILLCLVVLEVDDHVVEFETVPAFDVAGSVGRFL
jgi:hypothetical protein